MATSPRQELLLDADWLFHLGDIDSPVPRDKHIAAYMANKAGWARGAARINYDDSDWRVVNLPHDWSVEGPIEQSNYLDNGFLPRGVGWYRKHLRLDESDRGQHLAIRFDGVSSHCTVYVNGHLLHRNFSGYTSFTVDISDVATFGDDAVNVIAVRVDATPIEGWWYEGAGIYRHAWLIRVNSVHLAADGVFVQPKKGEQAWDVDVELMLGNTSDQSVTCEIVNEVFDPDGGPIMSSRTSARVRPRSSVLTPDVLWIPDPRLWSVDSPNLHTLRTVVWVNDEVIEDRATQFGCRAIRFDPEHGFFLNGQPLKLKGTCNHQDHAGVGVAVPDSIHEFRIRRLKAMGCNAYRCAHHPPAPELLNACDRLGMVVMDENRTFGSSPEHMSQLRSMVLRDRNHPSVILWSLCNEEAIQGTPAAANIAKAMAAEVRRLDPSRPVTAAVSGGILNDDSIADSIEACGINYQLPVYDAYHAKHPTVPVIAAETHSTFSTRGTYETSGHYFASYDADVAPWGATARDTWRHVSSRPFVAGLFGWTGFDYRGEPTPHGWPVVNAQFGIMDTCGFEKDAFFLHKAWWTKEPFVHLLPHWSWPGREGDEIRVMAYTNGDAVEMFLNGESRGRKDVDPIKMVEWRVPYRAGSLRAVAYRGDRVVAEAVIETTGPTVALGLEVHPSAAADPIPADGEFALPITVFATDASGRRVPAADDHVMFAIDGPATIVGVGNGDPTCHEPDKAPSRSLFRGLAQVIIQTATTSGEIVLTASAKNRASATIRLISSPAAIRPAVAPARRRLLLTDWRMSPITAQPPDVSQDVSAQDMNSWERVTPGHPQLAWNAASGYAIYRTTFIPPKSLQSCGGEIVFHAVVGAAEFFANGLRVPAHVDGALARVPFPATTAPLTLSVIIRSDARPAGLTKPVEICATSQNNYAKPY